MGYLFGIKPHKEDKNIEYLYDLDGAIDELMFRYEHNQSLYPYYRKVNWDEVCDDAIDMLNKLKGCKD